MKSLCLIRLSGKPEQQADWPWLHAWLLHHYPEFSSFSSTRQKVPAHARLVFFTDSDTKEAIQVWKVWKNRLQGPEGKLPADMVLWAPGTPSEEWLKQGFHWLVHGPGTYSLVLLLQALEQPLNPFFDKIPGIAFQNMLGKMSVQEAVFSHDSEEWCASLVPIKHAVPFVPIDHAGPAIPLELWPQTPTLLYAQNSPEEVPEAQDSPYSVVLSPQASREATGPVPGIRSVLTAWPAAWPSEAPLYVLPWQDHWPGLPGHLPIPQVVQPLEWKGWHPLFPKHSAKQRKRIHRHWSGAIKQLHKATQRPFFMFWKR